MDPTDPTQNPTPDPTQDPTPATDQSDPTAGPDQAAIDAALTAYQQAVTSYNNLAQQYDVTANDPSTYTSAQVSAASSQLDNARTQLGTAARGYATILGQVATARSHAAQAAKDPNEQRLWANEADKASAQQQLYSSEADMYQAKTTADIQAASTRAQAALQNAQSTAARTQSTSDLQATQSLLNQAKAAQIPALTQSTIALHTAQIQSATTRANAYASRVAAQNTVSTAQAGLDDARAASISGPQAQSLLTKSELDQAKAAGLNLDQGATLDKIQAAAGLSDARIRQIYANIGKSQVLPYNDKTNPNLTIFNPVSGAVTGAANPGYVNPTLQGITDQNAAIQEVQNEIASGKMAPDEGTALIDALRQALQYKALGVTPQDYTNMQLQQANLGMNVLGKYQETLQQGQTAADQFAQLASKIKGNVPAVTPYSTFGKIADNLYGPDVQQAQSLIQQVQPVTDRLSALKNIDLLTRAKAALTGAPIAPSSSNPNPQQPPLNAPSAAPSQPASPSAAFLATATAQPNGGPPVVPGAGGMPQNMQTWEAMGNA